MRYNEKLSSKYYFTSALLFLFSESVWGCTKGKDASLLYKQKKEEVQIRTVLLPPAPLFQPLEQDPCFVDVLASEIFSPYQSFFDHSYYDQSVYWMGAGNNKKNLSLKAFEKYGSANCVGINSHLIRVFRDKAHFQMIPGILPNSLRAKGSPQYDHTALIASCRDGYVLIDPTMNVSVPMIIRSIPGEKTKVNSNGLEEWVLTLSSNKKEILVEMDSVDSSLYPWTEEQRENQRFSYHLEEIVNADESITLPLNSLGRKILIFPFSRPKDPFYTLIFRLEKSQLEFSKLLANGESINLLTLPFDEYFADPNSFNKKLHSHSEIGVLRMSRTILESRIEGVLRAIQSQND